MSESNYHTTKFFKENVLAIEMRKTQILITKSSSAAGRTRHRLGKTSPRVHFDI